jgi:hypothetical protein
MILKVASTFREILDGWRLVYQQYLKSALIEVNPFSVFTYPQYISKNSAVILGKVGNTNVCSVSAVLDSKKGLPLDVYFHDELDGLRKENKKLVEIGLLANKSEKASPFYIIELLSSIARFGVYSNFHNYVIGVHPRSWAGKGSSDRSRARTAGHTTITRATSATTQPPPVHTDSHSSR